MQKIRKLRKIAVIMGTGIGDLVIMQPFLQKLKKEFPTCKITLISKIFRNKDLLNIFNNHDFIVELSKNRSKIIRKLRKANFDLVFVGFNAKKGSTILSRLIGKNIILGFKENKLSVLYNKKVKKEGKTILEANLNALKKLGIKIGDKDCKINLKVKKSRKKFNKFVALHCGVKKGYFTRFWPPERWADVLEYAYKKYKLKPVFIGGKEDIKETNKIINFLKIPYINLVDQLAFLETISVINDSKLFISTNSGPMHIAAALEKKQIALCGPSKLEWEPFNKKAIIIRETINRKRCNPPCDEKLCYYKDCLCMKKIETDRVKFSIEKFMKNAKN